MVVNILFSIISILLFSSLNRRGIVDGPPPKLANFIFTLIFLTVWFAYGVFKGRASNKAYVTFSISFWLTGMGVYLIATLLTPSPLWIMSFAFLAPANGLEYILHTSGYLTVLLNICTPLVITLLGYHTGSKIAGNT